MGEASMMKVLITLLLELAAAQPDRQAMVGEIHRTPGILWTAGMDSRFRGGKFKAGVKPQAMARRAAYARAVKKGAPEVPISIPESFDSEANWPLCAKVIGDIRDQSMCGCCWAFAAASAASDRLCIETNGTTMVPLSAQDICFCASEDGCEGDFDDLAWDYIQSQGVVTGGQYQGTGPFGAGFCQDFSLPNCHHHGPQGDDPYPPEFAKGCPYQHSPQCPNKCSNSAEGAHTDFQNDKWSFSGETQSASGEKAIQRAIMEGGPVETGYVVYEDFNHYVSGIYHYVKGASHGGHAVKIVGWGIEKGVKYWKIANSWNPNWGEKGYFRIKRGDNESGIEDQVTFSPAHAKWSVGGSRPSQSPGHCPYTEPDYCDVTTTWDFCKLNHAKCKLRCGCCDMNPPAHCLDVPSEEVVLWM
mmetsp:Transcript_1997/g.3703  ORF Transcript_1997/g.3703 Transcript_1997/m.3703 type:complete len:415 (-) Transcript_1997:332-1576(-)